jgi:hypothetical protein
MKSERRHELHKNVLEQNLSHAGQYVKAHSNLFVWGMLAVAVAVLALVIWNRQTVKADIEFANEYNAWVVGAESQTGNEEEVVRHHMNIIDNDKNAARAASAAFLLGNHYYNEYLASPEQAGQAKFADQAKQAYSVVVAKFPQQRIMLAKAHFALGKLAESQGDFKLAETEYNAVQGMTDLAGIPVVEYAVEAVKQLPAMEKPLMLASTRPTTEPAGATTQSSSAPVGQVPATSAPAPSATTQSK